MTHPVRHLTGTICSTPTTCEATDQHHAPTHCRPIRAYQQKDRTAYVPRHRGPGSKRIAPAVVR